MYNHRLLVYAVVISATLLFIAFMLVRQRTKQKLPRFIRQNNFQVMSDFARQKDYLGLGWRPHQHHTGGRFTANITPTDHGLRLSATTIPEPENSGMFAFNHLGLNLKPVKQRTGIAVEVDIDTIDVKACPTGSKRNLARFVSGAVFFSHGPRRNGDHWYNSMFVATGIGMLAGPDRPFNGLGAFAVILHCKDTCLVLEEFSPPGKEAAEVLLIKPLGPVQPGETVTIGVEFVERDKKVIFYQDNVRHEHVFDMDIEFTKFNPFLKFDLANFTAPCDNQDAVAGIGVTVRKVYIKSLA